MARGSRSEQTWKATLELYAFPIFGELPVQIIDTAVIMRAIEPLWSAK